jgi:hypothetical protein
MPAIRPQPKRKAPAPSMETGYLPAPIGGINTIDVATKMPQTDSIYAWNMVPGEGGLRVRLGYREWLTTLGANDIRTIIPFVGSHKSGSSNALFCAAEDGIYDVSTSGVGTGSQVISFGTTSGEAGMGISCHVTTPAGRFLMYCDEENGLHIYTESTLTWAIANTDTTVSWAGSTAYLSGDRVVNGGNVYTCTVAGTSAASGGPAGVGAGIVDNTVTWDFIHAQAANAIGPSQADRRAGFTFDTANMAAVMVWKNRVWLVEKDTTRAWYLGINAVYGTATSFDFGSKMISGGPLANLYDWSYDGGNGMDSLLVAISTAGDVVMYAGTDPSTANTFGLKGSWSVGGVPYGRNVATKNGGEILVLSLVGLIPLTKLVAGARAGLEEDSGAIYATAKVANLFNTLTAAYKTLRQWAVHLHPTDNTLLVMVPTADGEPTQQLAMSLSGQKGWGRYRDIPATCAAVWNGQLYFGTNDGRICINDGYLDNVAVSGTTYTPIQWSLLTGFDNLGNARQKRVSLILPEMQAQSPNPAVEAKAFYDLNTTEPAPPTGGTSGSDSGFDLATWDSSVWGGEYAGYSTMQGANGGIGRSVAIAARGTAVVRTVLNGFHVFYEQGGVL